MRWGTLWMTVISGSVLAFGLEPNVVLTAQENGTERQDTFRCLGTIHGYVVLPEKAVGSHQLEGVWTLPNGRVLEHSHIPLDFEAPGRSTAYLWLTFPPRPAMTLFLKPEEDEARLSYNGTWKLHILWDQKPLLQTTFNVRCS